MRSTTYIIIAAISLLALLAACGRGKRDYSSWQQLPADGWAYNDTISLLPVDTTLTDNDSILNGSTLHVALRHSNAYPYSNIWLELTYHATVLICCVTPSTCPSPTSTAVGSEAVSVPATSTNSLSTPTPASTSRAPWPCAT